MLWEHGNLRGSNGNHIPSSGYIGLLAPIAGFCGMVEAEASWRSRYNHSLYLKSSFSLTTISSYYAHKKPLAKSDATFLFTTGL